MKHSPDFKLLLAILLIVGLSAGMASRSQANPPDPGQYQAYPAFLAASVPPLVMLVMGRDHKLYYEAYNDATDLDEDGVLDTTYKPDQIDYYGYFDSFKYYAYSSTNKRFEPAGVTADKRAPSGSYWSGDFLNYLTMSRIDAMRKVLYGGYRSVDTASETVLERAYIPNDAHCWGKEYTDEATDGYNIADYTPYTVPTTGNRHLFGSGSIVAPGNAGYAPLLRVKLNSPHRIWTWVSAESGNGILGDTLVGTPDHDFEVRVQVGVATLPDPRSEKKYGSGTAAVYKPIGILQRHGESNGMFFGLITGSYGNHLSGGVLRKNIASITDEIDPSTGRFNYKTDSTITGIIKTIDNLRVIGFNHGTHYWDTQKYNGPISEGEGWMWGNPVAEMMYESLRYFAGAGSTSAFSSSVSDGDDRGLDLPLETWQDPYSVYPSCSKPIMLVLTDINPSYDTDQLPGSYFGGSGSLGTFSAQTEADTISSGEGFSGTSEHYIGESGGDNDSSCSAKGVTSLGNIRGICPEEPTKLGGYYSASVAYYGAKTALNSASAQLVSTYAVALASPLPQIKVPMDGNQTITLVPFAKTVYSTGGGGVEPDRGDFQPTCAIVDFYVDSITPTSGKFRVTYEHAEQGSDYDMDALITYEYTKTSGSTLEIQISSLESTYGGGSKQHFGYIISGTDADGVYLEIKNATQDDDDDRDFYLDTPGSCGPNTGALDTCWDDNIPLLNERTRTFTASSSSAATLLKDPLYYAAKWGGFVDRNGNQEPDQQDEWDKDGDGVPDTYFYVVNPLKLETQLNRSFADILDKTSSGTTASVLATNSEGEGHLVQAYFKPQVINTNSITHESETLSWLGYLQSLWVDPWGNLREDTDADGVLDLTNSTEINTAADVDRIITYYTDAGTGDTKVRVYTTHHLYNPANGLNTDCRLATCPTLTYDEVDLEDIVPIFEAGQKLHLRSADDRKIFTFVDGDGQDNDSNGLFDESGEDESPKTVGRVLSPFTDGFDDDVNEVIRFHPNNYSVLKPFLGVEDDAAWAYLDADPSSPDYDTRVKNLINYIRGKDSADLIGSPECRNRSMDGNVWKLGDIVGSTPTSISKPPDNYHIIYGDESYQRYLNAVKGRETVVYVGANDGMLHAFTSWKYNGASGFVQPSSTTEGLGDELWAYIPQTLLPHLKFLANPEYAHSFYVDLKPKIFDAQILPDDTHYTDGDTQDNWGTIMLVGLNLGGKAIWADGDFGDGAVNRQFHPTFACLDITDPRDPRLLWERSYEGLALTTSFPGVVKVGGTRSLDSTSGVYSWSSGVWYAVLGSGPTAYDGTSDQSAQAFIVDLKTGDLVRLFDTGVAQSLMNSPVSYDKGLDFDVDGIYFGSVAAASGGGEKGMVYKINTRTGSSASGAPSANPTDWTLSSLFDSPAPISAPLSLSTDQHDNVWAFFGTGRYMENNNYKTDATQQYFFGIKDPYFNAAQHGASIDNYYYNDTAALTLDKADLFNANPYSVHKNRDVTGVTGIENWNDLVDAARVEDGWYYALEAQSGLASERVISKATVLGGIVFFPGYTPNQDVCGFGGSTNFYAMYYETGTAYFRHILPGTVTTVTTTSGETEQVNRKFYVGSGAPPPAAGFHIGREKGATAFLQMSTGQVVKINVDTAFPIKSNIAAWRELDR